MRKRLIPTALLIVYSAILIKVMVFKDIPTIKVGHIMLNFGGTDPGLSPNFIPFKTIVPYLFGYKGLIIAGINIVGNIALLVPLGLLLPFIIRRVTWKTSLLVAVTSGLAIEILQTVLDVGIFDIDDVILNALGVMVGYWVAALFFRWVRLKNYNAIVIAAILTIVAAVAFYAVVVYPISHQRVTPNIGVGGDLCGGTGGNGEIVSVGMNTFRMKRNDGTTQIVMLTDQAVIRTPAGIASLEDLKIGERVTLVGGPNPDGSFTADAVMVCARPSSESQSL